MADGARADTAEPRRARHQLPPARAVLHARRGARRPRDARPGAPDAARRRRRPAADRAVPALPPQPEDRLDPRLDAAHQLGRARLQGRWQAAGPASAARARSFAPSIVRLLGLRASVGACSLAPSIVRSPCCALRASHMAVGARLARRSSLFDSRRLARPPFSRPRDTDRTDVVVVVREGNGTKGVPHEGHLIVDYSSRAEDGCRPDVASRATLARTFFLCGLPRPGAPPPTPFST